MVEAACQDCRPCLHGVTVPGAKSAPRGGPGLWVLTSNETRGHWASPFHCVTSSSESWNPCHQPPSPRPLPRPSPSQPTQSLFISSEQSPLLLIFSEDGHMTECAPGWEREADYSGCVGGGVVRPAVDESLLSKGLREMDLEIHLAVQMVMTCSLRECGNPRAHNPKPRPLRPEPPRGVPRHYVES